MFGDRPRVTPEEWKNHIRPSLSSQGWTDHQLDRVEALFEQSFQKNPAIPEWKPGIDQAALDQTMTYLKSHADSIPDLGPQHIALLQSELEKYIGLTSL